MKHIRGLRDIKTHGTLAREGCLVSVARDWHQINKKGVSPEERSWDGTIKHMAFKRGVGTRKPSRNLFQELALERKIQATLTKQAQESVAEMEMFAGEGVSGALAELWRLKAKLSQFEGICEG